ncbi:unnamed protein product [Protopolystoma xenopodis]|uniref:Uncharacterized protein n=1 Tax=Protopolystoma xenopodis TaxID=117903 RepID=A0A448XDI0_9PLAT|nr:unnamed protein product [Protopolystoma xenopodis]
MQLDGSLTYTTPKPTTNLDLAVSDRIDWTKRPNTTLTSPDQHNHAVLGNKVTTTSIDTTSNSPHPNNNPLLNPVTATPNAADTSSSSSLRHGPLPNGQAASDVKGPWHESRQSGSSETILPPRQFTNSARLSLKTAADGSPDLQNPVEPNKVVTKTVPPSSSSSSSASSASASSSSSSSPGLSPFLLMQHFVYLAAAGLLFSNVFKLLFGLLVSNKPISSAILVQPPPSPPPPIVVEAATTTTSSFTWQLCSYFGYFFLWLIGFR